MKLKQVLFVFLFIGLYNSSVLLGQEKDSLAFVQLSDNIKQKKYDLALKQGLLLKDRFTNNNDGKNLYRTLQFIGYCHNKSGNYKLAISYYLKALDGYQLEKDSLRVIGTCNNIVKGYANQKKYDSAIFYSKQSLHYNKQFINTDWKFSSYSNLSGLFMRKEKYDIAIKYSDSALSILQIQKKGNERVLNAYNNRASIYYKQKKYVLAKEYYLKGYVLLNKETDLNFRKGFIRNLSRVYMMLGEREKAKDFVSLSIEIIDSLQKLKYDSKITEIEAKYNVNKEMQVTQLERQKKERVQLWFLGITILLLVLSAIIWLFYRDNKIKKERLALRLVNQEFEEFQNIRKLQLQNQSKVLNAVAVGKETERIAIAQVLHDSVGALLSSANMHLQVVKKKSEKEIVEIQKSQQIIQEASSKVRNLSHQLISEVLLKFGLVVAIESLCTKYSNDELVFELVAENEIPRFQQAFEIKMHSIIEELLNNCIKHSKATEVVVSLKCQDKMFTAIVEDNGIGLEVEKVNQFQSVGLAQINARVESVGGIFIITSIKNKYARFYIKIPVEK